MYNAIKARHDRHKASTDMLKAALNAVIQHTLATASDEVLDMSAAEYVERCHTEEGFKERAGDEMISYKELLGAQIIPPAWMIPKSKMG